MTPFADVTQVGLGLLAFARKELRQAREHFLTAMKIAEAETSAAGRLKFAACMLHCGYTAIFIGHAGEAKLLFAAAEEALAAAEGTIGEKDEVTSYALRHGRWFARSLKAVEAERRGDRLLAARHREEAARIKPEVPVTSFLRRTVDDAGRHAAYGSLALMQEDPASIVVALTESARPLSAWSLDRAGEALSAAEAIASAMRNDGREWLLGDLYLREGRAHLLRAAGKVADAARSLEIAESRSLPRTEAIDELRTVMLVERSRLLVEMGATRDACRVLELALSFPNLSSSLRRIVLHEKAEWQADEESMESALNTLESAQSLDGDARALATTELRLANLNLRLGLLEAAQANAREAAEILESGCQSDGRCSHRPVSAVVSAEYPTPDEIEGALELVIAESMRIRSLGRVGEAHHAELLRKAYERFAQVADARVPATANALAIRLTANLGLGAVAGATGNHDVSRAFYADVVRETEVQNGSANLRRIRRDAQVNLAALAYRAGDLLGALERCSALVEESSLDRSQRALCYFVRGAASDALGQADAVADYRRAQQIYESVTETLRPEIIGNFQEAQTGLLYARLARGLAREGKPWEALVAAEAGRTRGLARRARQNAKLPPLDTTDALSVESYEELARTRPDTLFLAWMILESLEDSEKMLLFSVHGQKIVVKEIAFETSVRLRLQQFRGALRPSSTGYDLTTLAKGLYNDLLAQELSDSDPAQIAIVADGALHDLPWGALVDDRDKFLIERCPVFLLPSIGSLALPSSNRDTGPLLRVAYDPFPDGLYRDGQLVAAPIPHVYEEARIVGSIWPSGFSLVQPPPSVKTVTDALVNNVWTAALFSVHGRCHLEDGLKSALVVAGETGSAAAFLEAWQIARLRVNCGVVFLSACDTGRGRQVGTEGLLGLAWAFRAAGCGAVVATLWPVVDNAMPALVARFFTELREGEKAPEALRRACLAMLNGDVADEFPEIQPAWKHPYYWSAVQVWGEA